MWVSENVFLDNQNSFVFPEGLRPLNPILIKDENKADIIKFTKKTYKKFNWSAIELFLNNSNVKLNIMNKPSDINR
jgi:hypothetical protein